MSKKIEWAISSDLSAPAVAKTWMIPAKGLSKMAKESDTVITPDWVARAMIKHFKPSGKILDPCTGDGVFLQYLKDAEWCEISKGRDFYDYQDRADWIVGNPPYSIFSDFLRKSFEVADNILYLIPANKVFNSHKMMKEVAEYGGVVEMLVVAPGSRLKFPIGFCIAAVHFQRNYKGAMKIGFVDESPHLLNKKEIAK